MKITEHRTKEIIHWLDDKAADHALLFEEMTLHRDASALIRQLQAAEQAAWHAELDAGRELGRSKAHAQQPAAVDSKWVTAPPDLYNEISSVLNRHSAENESNTPDYVLARFLLQSLTAFNTATNRRSAHYGNGDIASQPGGSDNDR